MITISAAEFEDNVGVYAAKALIEPVTIIREGRERLVMVSAEEYRRLKRQAREVLAVGELSYADLEAVCQVEMADSHLPSR